MRQTAFLPVLVFTVLAWPIAVGAANTTVFYNLTDADGYAAALPENSPVGTVVAEVFAEVPDGAIPELSFSPPSLTFALQNSTVLVMGGLDREMVDFFNLTIQARNGDTYSYTQLFVTVLDTNDNAPFIPPGQVGYVYPTDPNGTLVLVVNATDRDVGANSLLTFSITAGNEMDFFLVDAVSGALYTLGDVDILSPGFNLTIRVQDSGNPTRASGGSVEVLLVNNTAPMFIGAPYNVSVSEATPIFTRILQVMADESNSSGAGTITYSLTSTPQSFGRDIFSINSVTGWITLQELLDYEAIRSYSFVVVASDDHPRQPESAMTGITVQVQDVNDNAPVFQPLYQSIQVPENTPVNTTIASVHAVDRDSGSNGLITYHANPLNDISFRLNSSTGAILLSRSLSRPTQASYLLLFLATDAGIPSFRSIQSAAIFITVTESNDHVPQINTPSASVDVFETGGGTAVGVPFYTVNVTDGDGGQEGNVSLTLTAAADPGLFQVQPYLHCLFYTRPLDYETSSVRSWNITLAATDGGNMSYSSVENLTINLLDGNEFAPAFSSEQYVVTLNVSSGFAAGDPVTQIVANDADGFFNKVQYQITAGNNGEFAINPTTGLIMLGTARIAEPGQFNLTVTATDNGIPFRRNSSVVVDVMVIFPPNDHFPVFARTYFNISISEYTPVGTSIATVTASDQDAGEAGLVEYLQHSSFSDFSVELATGIVMTRRVFDYQNDSRMFRIIIQARDRALSGSRTAPIPAVIDVHIVSASNVTLAIWPTGDYITVPSGPVDVVYGLGTNRTAVQGPVCRAVGNTWTEVRWVEASAGTVITGFRRSGNSSRSGDYSLVFAWSTAGSQRPSNTDGDAASGSGAGNSTDGLSASLELSDAGDFACELIGSTGLSPLRLHESRVRTVIAAPPAVESLPTNMSVLNLNPLSLTCIASGDNADVRWLAPAGVNSSQSTALGNGTAFAVLSILSVNWDRDGGAYVCEAFSAANCTVPGEFRATELCFAASARRTSTVSVQVDPPLHVENITVGSITSSSAEIEWIAPTSLRLAGAGQAPVRSYNLTWTPTDVWFSSVPAQSILLAAPLAGSLVQYTLTLPSAYANVSVEVFAIDETGQRGPRRTVFLQTKESAPTGTVANLTVTSTMAGITIGAFGLPLSQLNGQFLYYDVSASSSCLSCMTCCQDNECIMNSTSTVASSMFTITVGGVCPSVVYDIAVSVCNSIDCGPARMERVRAGNRAPTPPENVQATPVNSSAISVSWQEPAAPRFGFYVNFTLRLVANATRTETDDHGPERECQLYPPDATVPANTTVTPGRANAFVAAGLCPDTEYDVSVWGSNEAGRSVGEPVTTRTLPPIRCVCANGSTPVNTGAGECVCRNNTANVTCTPSATCPAVVCDAENTTDSMWGMFDWPATIVNTTTSIICPTSFGLGQLRYANRTCLQGNDTTVGLWDMPLVQGCDSSEQLEEDIQQLSMAVLNATTAVELVSAINSTAQRTDTSVKFTPTAIQATALAILHTVNSINDSRLLADIPAQVVLPPIVQIVNRILDEPPQNIPPQSADSISQSLERLVTAISVDNGTSLISQRDNIGVIISCPSSNRNTSFRAADQDGRFTLNVTTLVTPALRSRESVAFDILESQTTGESSNTTRPSSACLYPQTSFILYTRGGFFVDANLQDVTKVASPVLSAQVTDGSPFPPERNVQMAFDLSERNLTMDDTVECVFWEYSNGTGVWSSRGCSVLDRSQPDRVVCQCDHLTNFAILVSRSAVEGNRTRQPGAKALSIVTYVGCGISMVALLCTIVTILMFKSLRNSHHQRLVLGLSVTLLLLLAIFISTIWAASNKQACQAVAIVMHYLLLCAFLWMSAEASFLYKQTVTVFGGAAGQFIKKLVFAVFVIPLVIVGTSAGATQLKAYSTNSFCWISDIRVFYGAFVVPMALTLIYNLAILTRVVLQLHERNKVHANMQVNKQRGGPAFLLRFVVWLSVLLGVTWTVGLLVVIFDHIILHWLFTVLNVSQGALIFLFHTARPQDVRKEWREWLRRWRPKTADAGRKVKGAGAKAPSKKTGKKNKKKSGNAKPGYELLGPSQSGRVAGQAGSSTAVTVSGGAESSEPSTQDTLSTGITRETGFDLSNTRSLSTRRSVTTPWSSGMQNTSAGQYDTGATTSTEAETELNDVSVDVDFTTLSETGLI